MYMYVYICKLTLPFASEGRARSAHPNNTASLHTCIYFKVITVSVFLLNLPWQVKYTHLENMEKVNWDDLPLTLTETAMKKKKKTEMKKMMKCGICFPGSFPVSGMGARWNGLGPGGIRRSWLLRRVWCQN